MARLQTSPKVRFAGIAALVAVALLGAYAYQLRHQQPDEAQEASSAAPLAPIEVDRFSARLEKSNDEERLSVGFRLRSNAKDPLECYLFVVARTERGTSRSWAIWPSGSPGLAISAGGQFHAAHPASGHPLSLGRDWERIDAVFDRTPGQQPFDSVSIYVVSGNGNILLARPFAL